MTVDLDVKDLLDGDPAAWTSAVRRATQIAMRKVWVSTGIDPQDVAQDACVRLQKELPGMQERGMSDAAPALHRAVRFATLEAVRSSVRRGEHDAEAGAAIAELLAQDLRELEQRWQALCSRHTQREISKVFSSTDGQLLLRWFEGHRLADISADTGLGLTTIHGRIRRAAKAIERCISAGDAMSEVTT